MQIVADFKHMHLEAACLRDVWVWPRDNILCQSSAEVVRTKCENLQELLSSISDEYDEGNLPSVEYYFGNKFLVISSHQLHHISLLVNVSSNVNTKWLKLLFKGRILYRFGHKYSLELASEEMCWAWFKNKPVYSEVNYVLCRLKA